MSDELIPEEELAHRLGVSRDVLRSHREIDLVKNEDWKKNGRSIVFTSAGVERLTELIGVEIPKKEKNAVSEPSEADEITVWVKRHNFPNSKIVLAEKKSGEEVWVRVKDNKNFRVIDYRGERMELSVVKDGAGWALNRRCPRWPGKW